MTVSSRKRWFVPDHVMLELGTEATKDLNKCADNWSDSEILSLRARLPQPYHAVPPDELRRQWVNLRKRGESGMKLNGHGAAKGWKEKERQSPEWYVAYLNSEYWQSRRDEWLLYWGKCCLCGDTRSLDVHHNCYARLRREQFSDCVVLCRDCHNIHHDALTIPDDQPLF